MDYDLDSKDDFLDIRDDTYFDPDVNGQLGFRINPEDMEELGQIYLAKLKSLREQFNWENEVERYPFYLRLAKLMKDWKGNLPNLRDIFRAEEIDHLLLEAAMNRKRTRRNYRGRFFVEFVVRTGYKDNPELNEDGKPSSRRITAVHRVTGFESFPIIKYLFQIYNRFDVNYTDDSGYTHFHAACRIGDYDVIKEFLELGQDPNCLWTETGDSPLHLALVIHYYNIFTKDTIQLLLRSGADLNWANKEGSTPLHVICKNCGYVRLIKEFFEITDANQQTILIDAKDKLGRTSLQLSVASLFPDLVDVLLDRGADLSSFVFPTENYFEKTSNY
ncbi:unnamed protein product [Trichogramma brassicae]|uniref:Uncharacterized protein n=1 Tax=Trichogramma brassicae TaxID=86971 RepID=A0A6H5I5J7_9HYME|nr:unnamed protein product [Trichogramma brassicae]